MDKGWSRPWHTMFLPKVQTLLFCIWDMDLQEPCNVAKYFDADHCFQLNIGLTIIDILVNRCMFRTWTFSLISLLCISAKHYDILKYLKRIAQCWNRLWNSSFIFEKFRTTHLESRLGHGFLYVSYTSWEGKYVPVWAIIHQMLILKFELQFSP